MYNTRGNIETDHAHGDTASRTGINEQDAKKYDWHDSEDPELSQPECWPTVTRIQRKSNGAEDKQIHGPFSIPQLQEDSAKLLQTGARTATATIFDLRQEDRQRVAELINELASTSQNLAQLEENHEVVCRRGAEYQEKAHKLMKKVDVLNEKCQKLEDEKVQMKERHVESLMALNKTVTQISYQFEHSAKELHYLKENNALLQSENKLLREKVISVESKLASTEKSNQKLSENLHQEKSRHQELKDAQKLKERSKSRSKNKKSVDTTEKSEDNQTAGPDTQFDTQFFAAKSCVFEEEILHDLFFRF